MANDRRVLYTFDGDAKHLADTIKKLKNDAKALASAVDSVNKAVRGESRASRQASKVADQAKLLKAQNDLLAQEIRNQSLNNKKLALLDTERVASQNRANAAIAASNRASEAEGRRHNKELRDQARERRELLRQFPNRLARVTQYRVGSSVQLRQQGIQRFTPQGWSGGQSASELVSSRLSNLIGASSASREYLTAKKQANAAESAAEKARSDRAKRYEAEQKKLAAEHGRAADISIANEKRQVAADAKRDKEASEKRRREEDAAWEQHRAARARAQGADSPFSRSQQVNRAWAERTRREGVNHRYSAAPRGYYFGSAAAPGVGVRRQSNAMWAEYENTSWNMPEGWVGVPPPNSAADARRAQKKARDAKRAADAEIREEKRRNTVIERERKRHYDWLSRQANRSLNALQMAPKRVIDMTAALLFFQTFRGIQQAIAGSITSIIDFNEQIENSRLGMASTTTAAGQFVDQFGKALPIAEQVNIALREADSLIPKLLKVSAERGLNFEGMLSASTATAGFTRAAGFNEQQRIDVVTGIVALSQKLNISQGQIVKTIDNVIKGVRVQNTELGSTLGITSKQVKNWREQGTLAENLLRILQGTQEASSRALDTSTGLSMALKAAWGNFSITAGKPIFDLFKDIKRESLEFLNGLNGDDARLGPLRDSISAIATDMGKWVKSVRELAEGADYNAIKGHIEGIYKAAGTVTTDMAMGGLIAAVTTGHPYLGAAIAGWLSSNGYSITSATQSVVDTVTPYVPFLNEASEFKKLANVQQARQEHKALFGDRPVNMSVETVTEASYARMREEINAQREILAGESSDPNVNAILKRRSLVDSLVSGTYGSDLVYWDERTAKTSYGYKPTPEEPDEAELRRQARAVDKAKRDKERAANKAMRLATKKARSQLRRIEGDYDRSVRIAQISAQEAEGNLTLAQAEGELLSARGASDHTMMRYQGIVNQSQINVIETKKAAVERQIRANKTRYADAKLVSKNMEADESIRIDAKNKMLDATTEMKELEREMADLNVEKLATLKNQTAELERQKRAQFDIADEVMGMISALRDGRNIGDIASGFFRTQTDQMLNNFLRDGFAGGFSGLFGGGGKVGTGPTSPGAGGGGGAGGGRGMSLQGIMTLGAGALSAGFGLAGGIKRSQNTMYASGSKRDAMAIGGLLDSLGMGFLGKIGGNNRGSAIAGTGLAGAAGGAAIGAATGAFTGPIGAAVGAAIGLAIGGIISLVVKKPSTNKLINKSLKKVYKELGLAYTGDFSNVDTGAFPELRSMAGASAVQFGINLQGETIKPGRGAVNAGNISNKILNDAAALRLGIEDTRERVREVNKALGGDFDSQAARLVAQRANRQRAMRTLPQEGSVSSFWGRMAVQLERRKAGIGGGMSAGEIDAQFTSQLAGVVDSFIDLPESVDRTRIALTALSDDGTVSLTRLKNVAEDVVAVIGGGLPGAVSALSKGDSLLSARDVMTQAYNDAMIQRASKAIQDSALTSSAFQDSVALGTKSIEALARGDFAGAERLAIESRRAMDTASLETLKNLAPGTGTLRILGGNYGGGGLQLPSFGTDTMAVVPGGIGDPLLSITHGGETVRNPAHEDKLQNGVEDLKSIMTDVRDLLVSMNRRGGEAGSIMPQVIRAEVSVAEISDAQRAARTRQSSGSNNANGNIGLPM